MLEWSKVKNSGCDHIVHSINDYEFWLDTELFKKVPNTFFKVFLVAKKCSLTNIYI